MRFTLGWLKEHLSCDLAPARLGHILTMAGLELDALVDLSRGLEGVVVGELLAVEAHPQADRLTLCRVRTGEGERQVVCGATNHRVGDKVAVALPGATLPDGKKILESRIRGVESHGMLCSLVELGLAESSQGIHIFSAETVVGEPVARALGREEWLFDVAITPNRGDCLGVRGIARELAALEVGRLTPFAPSVAVDAGVNARHGARVVIEDGEGCARYAGRVIEGVTVAESPAWLKARLEAVGIRPINNVVDVTNLVMMDLGHPLHAFDLARLALPLVVRRAREGERFLALDGKERTLTPEMTVIADGVRPLALAGIMGGEESGTTAATRDLFLEAAWFEPVRIARTGRKLGLVSESRHRFERGCDPLGLIPALDLATHWILALCGGRAGEAVIADAGTWSAKAPAPFRFDRANRLGGVSLSRETMIGMLERLGCLPVGEIPGGMLFAPPSFRHDLAREEDLMEEVVRLFGYDRVETAMPLLVASPVPPDPMMRLLGAIKGRMAGAGFLEAVNYAFVHPAVQARFDAERTPLALLNPLSEEQSVMRTTLVAGLVETARRNVSRGQNRLRLFEMGRVFLPGAEGGLVEVERVAGLLAGHARERSLHFVERPVDFFDLKGEVEALVRGLARGGLTLEEGGPDFLHPGQKARLFLGGVEAGFLGALHPTTAAACDLEGAHLYLFELDVAAFLQGAATGTTRPLSRFPAVSRDFAFVLERSVPARAVMETCAEVAGEWAENVRLFDLYQGEGLGHGQKSLGVELVLRAADRTLNEAEVKGMCERVTARMAQRFGAVLRGG